MKKEDDHMNEYIQSVGVERLISMVQRVQPVTSIGSGRRTRVENNRKKAAFEYQTTGKTKKNNLHLSVGFSNTQFDARI